MSEQKYSYETLLTFCLSKPTEFDAFIRQQVKDQAEIEEQKRQVTVEPVGVVEPTPEPIPEPAPVTTKKTVTKKIVEPEPVASPPDSAVNTASTAES